MHQTIQKPSKPYGFELFKMCDEGEYFGKRLKGLCRVVGCKKEHGQKKALCMMHDAMVWRFRHPIESCYKALKCSARKRKIPCTITLEDFRVLITGTDYLEKRGRGIDALHVDRIDPSKGYALGNVRIITCSENLARRDMSTANNGRKRGDAEIFDNGGGEDWLYETFDEDSCPF